MTREQAAHVEPTPHPTDAVDGFVRQVDGRVEVTRGAGSSAIKLNLDMGEDAKPNADTPNNPRT